MKIVFKVTSENKQKAEDLLKKDDEISRGSITIRSASSVEINENCYFILVDAGSEIIEKAKHMLKDITEVYKHADMVIEKIAEQEDTATEGLGSILG